jgi:hypothetical protein
VLGVALGLATSPRRLRYLVGNELGLLLGEELGITLVLSSLWVFSSQASSILASSVSLVCFQRIHRDGLSCGIAIDLSQDKTKTGFKDGK